MPRSGLRVCMLDNENSTHKPSNYERRRSTSERENTGCEPKERLVVGRKPERRSVATNGVPAARV